MCTNTIHFINEQLFYLLNNHGIMQTLAIFLTAGQNRENANDFDSVIGLPKFSLNLEFFTENHHSHRLKIAEVWYNNT